MQPLNLVPIQAAFQTFALLEADLCLHLIERDEAVRAPLCELLDRVKLAALQERTRVTATIGSYRGFTLRVSAVPHPDADAPLTVHFTSPGQGEHAISAYEIAARTDAGVFGSADATLRRLPDDIRAARERVIELERRRESIHVQLEQPWDQAARYRRTVEDLNRVNAELMKDGTIDAAEAAPIELVEGEVETWASPDEDATEILAYSNAIPLPAAEQEFDSVGPARADTAAEAPSSAHTAGPLTNGTAYESTMLWDAVFQPVQRGTNGTNTNGKRGQADNGHNAAAPRQLSLFDL